MDRLPRDEPLFTRLERKKALVKSQLDQPQYYKDASSQLLRNETQSTAVDSNCPSHEQSTPMVMSSPNSSFPPYIKVEHSHEQTALLNPIKTEFESSSLKQLNVVSIREKFGDQFNNEQNDASTNGQMKDVECDQENGNQDDDDTSAVDHQQVHIPADNFVKHIEPDQLGNKFECDYEDCGKRTKYRTNLIRHIRTHTGERPFGCDWCGKAFATSSQLKCHARVHSEDRPFACDMPGCTSAYKNRRSLRKHQLIKHKVL